MKRFLLFTVLLVISFSGLLISQTYNDGMNLYEKAIHAKAAKNKQVEREALEEAFKIFTALASKNDRKSLIMGYLLSIRLGKSFSLEDELFEYVKNEYPNFPTVALIQSQFYGNDKTVLLNNLGEISRQNEQLAREYVEEAKIHAYHEEYREALEKLNQAEKLWKLVEIPELKSKYTQLKKEKEKKLVRDQIEDLIDKQKFQEALDILTNAAGILTAEEFSLLEKEIKTNWCDKILEEAKKIFNEAGMDIEKLNLALNKCKEAYRISPTEKVNEVKALEVKIQKKIDRITRPRYWRFFADLGSVGDLKKNIVNFDWNGTSSNIAVVTDSGTVKLNPESESKFSFNLGVSRMFSQYLGLLASVSFFRQPSKTYTDYKLAWTWYNGVSASITATMSDSGSVSLIPISLNLLTTLEVLKGLRFNLYGGPTIFLANVDLSTRIGYGIALEHGDWICIQWFPFQYKIKESGSFLGGNIGLDLEYQVSLSYGVYLGVQYFLSLPRSFTLDVVQQSYDGQMWDISHNPSDFAHLPDYRAKFNISYYRIHAGVKLFL